MAQPNCKGLAFSPSKCSGLPFEEKRQLAREIALGSEDAQEILSSFSRKELLELICAEMGQQRKYSGFTKFRMIEHLVNVISKNTKRKNIDSSPDCSVDKCDTGVKKQRQTEDPGYLPTNRDHVNGLRKDEFKVLVCPNLACKATLTSNDGFCKRCSCCICHHYDNNKDPSLWLTCDSDLPDGSSSCGMSCHLKCALRHDRTGISKNSKFGKLDGRFYCVSCGKSNDLMSTWRKQLMIAKDARRVDVLCLRISLCQKILDGTELYKDLHKRVDTAAKKLRKELGPLDRVCDKMGRAIVNRLSCGAEVQKVCASAVEALDTLPCQPYTWTMSQNNLPTCQILLEESSPTSVVIVLEYEDRLLLEFLGCRIWHRRSDVNIYPDKPTCIVLRPEKKFKISDLQPCTEYVCKVSLFSCTRVFGTWEAKWITPPSTGMSAPVSVDINRVIDERPKKVFGNHFNHTVIDEHPKKVFRSLFDCDKSEAYDYTAKVRSLIDINATHILSSESIPTTPSKVDFRQDFVVPSCKKQEAVDLNSKYDYCVQAIKSLEREGHLNVDFRVKFLTWFSLKATMQERRVVNAFVDTLANDPPSLAEQLIDAFADEICGDRTIF